MATLPCRLTFLSEGEEETGFPLSSNSRSCGRIGRR